MTRQHHQSQEATIIINNNLLFYDITNPIQILFNPKQQPQKQQHNSLD